MRKVGRVMWRGLFGSRAALLDTARAEFRLASPEGVASSDGESDRTGFDKGSSSLEVGEATDFE